MSRIAIISDWFLPRLGGIETHLAGLAIALKSAGHAPCIVTTIPGASTQSGVDVERIVTFLDPTFQLAISPALVRRMTKVLEGKFDIVHAHVSLIAPVALAGILAAQRLGLPCIVTFHSVLLRSIPIIRLANQLFGWSRGPTLLTGVSGLVASQVRQAFPGHTVTVLPNGVDFSFWQGPARQRLSTQNELIVVSAMRLNWKKRPLEMLEAFDTAHRQMELKGLRLRLKIAGEGRDRARIERRLLTLESAADIELLGTCSHEALRALYQNADMFVLASEEEAFGLAALEARCAGLPVITMAASGAKEFLTHGSSGLLARSMTEFSDFIVQLSTDCDFRMRLAQTESDLRRFDWPTVAQLHLTAYDSATALAKASPLPSHL